ncbi:hypothetical protein BGX31_003619, partial [Mortierella sp. GBA43]
MFAWENNESSDLGLAGVTAIESNLRYDIAKFDLNLELYESNDAVMGALSYSTALFDNSTMERHVGYLRTLLQAMAIDLDQPIENVELLAQDERDLVLRAWNSTKQGYPGHMCIHRLFEHQAERRGEAIALMFNDQSLTYTELNERANRLAHHLIGLGVQPDTLVAVCVERSLAMIVAVLAVLKAGGAYVPLDPTYPRDRLKSILEDAEPLIVLADNTGRTILSEADARNSHAKVMVDPSMSMDTSSSNPRVHGLTSEHLAYVIYTSGSTGRPKGVMIEHRGVVNHTVTRLEDFGVDESSQVLQFSSLNFDLSVIDMFAAFNPGATLHVVPAHIRIDRRELWNYMEQHSITLAVLPPAVLQECKGLSPLSTRLTVVSTGDALSVSLLHTLRELIPNGSVINEYGATEVTVNAVGWKCPDDGYTGEITPVGKPHANKSVYILDKNGRPMPLGAVGEIYLGGDGVARGYLNRPELTAKVFLPDPFAGAPNARMYKTGDMGRFLPDGNLVYCGRNDHQVKIRGFRIELGEIESRLVDHPLVETATVVVTGESSHKKLVAYVVAKSDEDLVRLLRSYLTSCLPDYM